MWISTKDKMPPEGEQILVYFKLNDLDYIQKGFYTQRYGIEAYGMLIPKEEYQHKITHWMPLPEIPHNKSLDLSLLSWP